MRGKFVYGSYGAFPLDIWKVIIANFLDMGELSEMLAVHPHFRPYVIFARDNKRRGKTLEQIKKLTGPTEQLQLHEEKMPKGYHQVHHRICIDSPFS